MATAPPRKVSRLQSCGATDWEVLLPPGVSKGGATTLLQRGQCTSPQREAVPIIVQLFSEYGVTEHHMRGQLGLGGLPHPWRGERIADW